MGALIGILVVWTLFSAGLGVLFIVAAFQRAPDAPPGPHKVSTWRLGTGIALIVVWAISLMYLFVLSAGPVD